MTQANPPEDVLDDVLGRLSTRREGYGRYRIEGEFARGGMGSILRVRDEDLRRDLAMKVILRREGKSGFEPRVLARFLEEAQVTGQLDHPGIVPVHEIGLDPEGRVYFTMRLVAGRDLEKIFDLVRTGAEGWSTTRVVGVLLRVCEAVAYAHEKGVVHRDLKPANVMVGGFGEVYVMDWGLARVLGRPDGHDVRVRVQPDEGAVAAADSPGSSAASRPPQVSTARLDARDSVSESPLVTMDGDVVGTPTYMSPEQARGDLAALGPASDVYAAGAMLYQLLAGHPPYVPPGHPADAISVWRMVREIAPHPLRERAPQAPAELVAICEKAMARDPIGRYPSMQALSEDLRAWLEGRVVRAYETGLLAEFRKWVKRNHALATTVIAATIVIVFGSAIAAIVLARKNEQLVISNGVALANETKAREQAAIADERATRILRLSDMKRLQELRRDADALWPATPARIADYERWLASARSLGERLPEHRAALTEIRARAIPTAGSADAATGYTFAGAEDRWQHDAQADLVDGLAAFIEPAHGLVAGVERRLEFARTVEERTLTGAEARSVWTAAIASIADTQTCPLYAGLRIVPQLGLLPIGRDAQSGLWEFAHVQSGIVPVLDPGTGALALTPESGIVLVLVPGGTFWMGAQNDDPTGENYDPQADPAKESPPHRVTLAPFFIGRHEMTQGQWLRFTGVNPSVYTPGKSPDEKLITLLHPVEQVNWPECTETLARMSLALPTEAQWEYAARAGTSTPWWTGEERESLAGAINLADAAAARTGAKWPAIADWPEFDDGRSVHAPVDEYRPNPWGLHNVHGNVWEWCRDQFGTYDKDVSEGDGERVPTETRFRINRGGSYTHTAAYARVSYRNNSVPETRFNNLGVRPARALDP